MKSRHSRLDLSLEKFASEFYLAIGSDLATKAHKHLLAREYDQLVSMRVDPKAYTNPEDYFWDVAVTDLLRKNPDVPTTIDRRSVAVENFWKSEQQCFHTNNRISAFRNLSPADLQMSRESGSRTWVRLLSEMRKICFDVLGDSVPALRGRHGPGATYADKGQLTTVPDKMASRPTLTPSAWPLLTEWSQTAWARACRLDGRSVAVVPGNRFTTVPKDNTKDRGICIEPSLNVFYQLGLGQAVRKRLRAWGIDLKHGQDTHRQVAREASLSGSFCTIDLSNASDTVCKELVRLLIPHDWLRLFEMLRSPTTLIEGKTVFLEKFSSMGNGYTFELETLIFFSAALACARICGDPSKGGNGIWVYGDDIIVPTGIGSELLACLSFLGFTPNREKTFLDGCFRESCGGDYFNGRPVRAHFLKETPNEPQHWIALANGIARMGLFDSDDYLRKPRLLRVWFHCLDQLPSCIRRLRGPTSLGDLVIHDAEDRWQFRVRGNLRYFRVYRPSVFRRVGWEHFKPEVVLATALLGVGDGRSGISPRSNVLGYKVGWVPVSTATSTWLPG